MEKTQSLAMRSQDAQLAVQIFKPQDLLKCKTIMQHTKALEAQGLDAKNTLRVEISQYVKKCSLALGLPMSDLELTTIAEELRDMYRADALEDIIEALKKGRRGLYGFGMHNRRALSLPLIHDWMKQHLEEKVQYQEDAYLVQKRKLNEQHAKPLSPKVQHMLDNYFKGHEAEKRQAKNIKALANSEKVEKVRNHKLEMIKAVCVTWSDGQLSQALKDNSNAPEVREVFRQEMQNRKRIQEKNDFGK